MDIKVVETQYLWSKLEDKIVPGDVIAYAITPKFDFEPPTMHGGTIVQSVNTKIQPFLIIGILIRIIDDKRLQILNSDGIMVVIDRTHFSDFSKIHGKDSEEAVALYFAVVEVILAKIKLPFDYGYKVMILCKLSRTFNVRYHKRIKKMMTNLYQPVFDAADKLGMNQV